MTKTLTSYEKETGAHESVFSLKHKASKRASEGNTTRMTAKRLQNKPQQATEPFKGLAIGRDWRVGADTLNIILYRRQVNNKTGKEYWRAHSYFATVANALVELVSQGVRDTELANLKTVCHKIEQLHKDIFKYVEQLEIKQ
jgi:hypothetical protein